MFGTSYFRDICGKTALLLLLGCILKFVALNTSGSSNNLFPSTKLQLMQGLPC